MSERIDRGRLEQQLDRLQAAEDPRFAALELKVVRVLVDAYCEGVIHTNVSFAGALYGAPSGRIAPDDPHRLQKSRKAVQVQGES